jgi:hypothetical protein
MRIDRLRLENFRGFESLELTVDPSFTLLLGENAAGKTALLDALAIALCSSMRMIVTQAGEPETQDEDVRAVGHDHEGLVTLEPQWPVRIEATGSLDGKQVSWIQERARVEDHAVQDTGDLDTITDELAREVQAGESRFLPLLAYYRAQRTFVGTATQPMRRLVLQPHLRVPPARGIHRTLLGGPDRIAAHDTTKRSESPPSQSLERAINYLILLIAPIKRGCSIKEGGQDK